MAKDKAYKEMCKEFDNGKRVWTFDEMADIINRNMGVPKEKVNQILNDLSKLRKKFYGDLEDGN